MCVCVCVCVCVRACVRVCVCVHGGYESLMLLFVLPAQYSHAEPSRNTDSYFGHNPEASSSTDTHAADVYCICQSISRLFKA